MSDVKVLGVTCASLIVIGAFFHSPPSVQGPAEGALTIRSDANRILLVWNGPVAGSMAQQIEAAIRKFDKDPRRLVVTLNSPGGSIGHGHEVMAIIRDAAQLRPIDTHVDNGGSCISMCVPIFLLGERRTAHPDATFMFHEASLSSKSRSKNGASRPAALPPPYRQALETVITDRMFEEDIGSQRVNPLWLKDMRAKIVGKDIWLTAKQLVDADSGVVDELSRS